MDSSTISREQIRAVVREALREVIPQDSGKPRANPPAPNCLLMKKIYGALKSEGESLVELNIGNDEQLNNFVRDFAKCLHDSSLEALIMSGRLRFKLKRHSIEFTEPPRPETKSADAGQQEVKRAEARVETGMLSEAKVADLAKRSQRIVIGKQVVLTPLAKDRARAIGIEIVRQ